MKSDASGTVRWRRWVAGVLAAGAVTVAGTSVASALGIVVDIFDRQLEVSLERRGMVTTTTVAPSTTMATTTTVANPCTVSGDDEDNEISVASPAAGAVICGFGGNDRIKVGPHTGIVTVFAGAGKDKICTANASSDKINGGSGKDSSNVDSLDETTKVEKIKAACPF